MFSELFIKRPILATVCSLLIILAGAIAIPTLPIARYPDLTPPSVVCRRVLHRRERAGGGERGDDAARAGHQRRRGHAVHAVLVDEHGLFEHHRHVRDRRDADLAAVNVQNRVNQALGRMPAEVRTNGISVTKNTAGFLGAHRLLLAGQPVRLAVHLELRRLVRARRVQARARRRQRHHLRRAQVRDAAVARSGQARRPRDHRWRCRQRAARAERAGRRRQRRRRAVIGGSALSAERPRGRPPQPGRRSSRTSS